MIYNDVYVEMNEILRAPEDVSINKKTRAFNRGQREFIERMYRSAEIPGSQLEVSYSLATTINTNYVSLPSDFLALEVINRKLSTNSYLRFSDSEIITYKQLVDWAGTNFYNSSYTGTPTVCAIKDVDKVYFDKYFSATGTDYIKIDYWKYPTDAVAYDQLPIENASGDFTVGETITGGTSGATATVYALDDDDAYVQVTSSSVSGAFQSGEEITGSQSSTTADTTSTISQKVQTMDLNTKYQTALATAGAMMYLYGEGSEEAAEKDAVLDALIMGYAPLNNYGSLRIR